MKRSASLNHIDEPRPKKPKLDRLSIQSILNGLDHNVRRLSPINIRVTSENVRHEVLEHANHLYEKYQNEKRLVDISHQELLLKLNQQHENQIASLDAACKTRYYLLIRITFV